PKPPSTSTPSSNTKTSEPPSKSQAKLWQLLQAKEERLEYELAKRTSSPPSSKKEQSPPYLQALRQGKALENLELEVLDLSHEVFEQKVLLKNASIRYLKAVGSVFKQDFVCKSCRIEVINMGSQLDKKTKTHFCKQWILEDVEVQNKADFRNALFEEKGQMYFVHFPPQGYFTFFQAKFQHSLEILNSRLGAIDLREVDCGGNFSIKESKILGQFNARKAHFQQSVLVADSQFHDKFILSHAHFQGSVAIVNSLFEKSLLWQGSKFSSTFEVRDGWAEGNVFLNQACFEQNARFCAHFEGAVYASGATFQGTLDLSNAQFSSKLALKNARIQGKIKMDHLKSNELEIQWQQVHKNLLSEEEGDYSQASKEYALLLEVFERKRHYREWDECYLAYRRAKRSSLNPNTLSKKLRKALEYCLDLSCGYGVYPFRLLSFGGVAVILFACLYFLFAQSNLVLANKALNISFEKALYFSLATFVGLETGWTPHPNSGIKWLVTLEALVGLSTFLCFLLLLGRRWFRF
ncbi:MAG: two pore domain potassium channel family protein, partial [Planctomycetota bacterium]